MNISVRRENGRLVEFTVNGIAQPLSEDPSLLQKAVNLAAAARRVVRASVTGNKVFVSDEEQGRRLVICQACEFYDGSTCKKCGCHVRFKAKLQTEHCPIAKW